MSNEMKILGIDQLYLKRRFRTHAKLICLIFSLAIIANSSCILGQLISAPERSFSPQDLLLTQEDLPSGVVIQFGPQQVSDNSKPDSSMEIALAKEPTTELGERRWEVLEIIYVFYSIERAKEDYSEITLFPGETDIEGWTFTSSLADEQKFSCYTYSNKEYPVCRWVARYDEIVLVVIAWIDPDRWTLDEVQDLVKRMDEKIAQYLSE